MEAVVAVYSDWASAHRAHSLWWCLQIVSALES